MWDRRKGGGLSHHQTAGQPSARRQCRSVILSVTSQWIREIIPKLSIWRRKMAEAWLLIYLLGGSSQRHPSPTICHHRLLSATSCFSFPSLRQTKTFEVIFKKHQKQWFSHLCLQCNVWAVQRWMMYVQSPTQGGGNKTKKAVCVCAHSCCTKSKFASSDASGGQTNKDCICEEGDVLTSECIYIL